MKTSRVPVALFVFNRHERLQETLTALKNNKIECLWVFADGPRNDVEAKDTQKVRDIIDAIDWIKPRKVYAKQNKGLSESIRGGLDLIFEEYDSVVVVEDDIVVQQGFYDFMLGALSKYKYEEKIFGVSGMRLPFKSRALKTYNYDAYFSPRFASWGWGTWKSRWSTVIFDPKKLANSVMRQQPDLSSVGADFPPMFRAAVIDNTLTGAWDVFCAASMLVNNQYFVMPTLNMVENSGFANGTHFSAEEVPSWAPKWEERYDEKTPLRLPEATEILASTEIAKDLADFYTHQIAGIPSRRSIRRLVKWVRK